MAEKESRKDSAGGLETRVFRAIESHVIPPKVAKSLVVKLQSANERAHPDDTPEERQDRIADQIVRRYAKRTAFAGAAAAVPGIVPGIGTAAAIFGGGAIDFISSMKLQIDMCRCLAECYGHDLTTEDANHLTILLAFAAKLEGLGGGAAADIASKAGMLLIRRYMHGPVLHTLQQMMRKMGIVLTQKGVAKGFPFGVGVAVGAGMSYTLTRYVGKQAKAYFQAERSISGSAEP